MIKKINKNRSVNNLKKAFKIELLFKISMIISLFLIVFFIFQTAEMTRDTYYLHNQNREISRILEENRKQEYNFVRSNSLSRIEYLIAGRGFEEITKIHHIQIPGSQVAAR